jgi:hypothetical protein
MNLRIGLEISNTSNANESIELATLKGYDFTVLRILMDGLTKLESDKSFPSSIPTGLLFLDSAGTMGLN